MEKQSVLSSSSGWHCPDTPCPCSCREKPSLLKFSRGVEGDIRWLKEAAASISLARVAQGFSAVPAALGHDKPWSQGETSCSRLALGQGRKDALSSSRTGNISGSSKISRNAARPQTLVSVGITEGKTWWPKGNF